MSILGYTTKRWPLWKSATKWDSEILNLGTSFDTQPHISFCNRKHRVMRTCEASAATVYVSFLTKFLQEATRVLGKACWVSRVSQKSCYNKHLTFLNEFGGQSSFCAILSWMNHEFFGLTYCFISIFQHVPSSFHSFSAQFHSFSVRFHPIFSAVWALIYLHITWFLNHSQALCWSVWSKWAVSLWPKKRGCKAQLLGGGVCWCWSQFLFIPAKVEGQGATIRVSQPNYPSTD